MASQADRKDFVIYGASGFTGQYVVKEVALKAQKDKQLTWAIAGRSRIKLISTLKAVESETGINLASVDVIVADTGDYDSLVTMTTRAKVVLNCVGPYRFYGEPVVKACVQTGAHYVDISGEPEFLEKMEFKYGEKAKEGGVYIVGACGLDCIPNDMGLVFARQKFDGKLAAINSFLSINSRGDKAKGINTGTWNTLVHSLGNWKELKEIRKQCPQPSTPKPAYRLPKHYVTQLPDGNYCVPFMGADKSVIHRSQRDEYVANDVLPINSNLYFKIGSLGTLIMSMVFGVVLLLLSLFSFGRSLLVKYPRFFSGGMVHVGGPPKDIIDNQSFSVLLQCHGYSTSEGQGRPDKKMTVRISGPDPGYVATSSFLVESAYTILREESKLPYSGGVLTTGFAFKDTTLIERLAERDIKFEVV